MRKEVLEMNKNSKSAKERLVQYHLSKYAKELQRHFNISDYRLKKIFIKSASSIKSASLLQKFLNMLRFKIHKFKNKF